MNTEVALFSYEKNRTCILAVSFEPMKINNTIVMKSRIIEPIVSGNNSIYFMGEHDKLLLGHNSFIDTVRPLITNNKALLFTASSISEIFMQNKYFKNCGPPINILVCTRNGFEWHTNNKVCN